MNYLEDFEKQLTNIRAEIEPYRKHVLHEQIDNLKSIRNFLLQMSLLAGGVLGVVFPLIKNRVILENQFSFVAGAASFAFVLVYGVVEFKKRLEEENKSLKKTQEGLNSACYGEYLQQEIRNKIYDAKNDEEYQGALKTLMARITSYLDLIPDSQRKKDRSLNWVCGFFVLGVLFLFVSLFTGQSSGDEKLLRKNAPVVDQSAEHSIPAGAENSIGINPNATVAVPASSPVSLPAQVQPSPSPESNPSQNQQPLQLH